MKKNKKKIIIITSIILLVIIIGMILYLINKSYNKENISNNDSFTKELQKVDITKIDESLELIKEHVVKVINKVGEKEIVGTGFFIKEGYLITNSHIVDIQGDITIEYSNGKNSKAKLVSNDIVSDVAILLVDDTDKMIWSKPISSGSYSTSEYIIKDQWSSVYDEGYTVTQVPKSPNWTSGDKVFNYDLLYDDNLTE